MPRFLFVLSIFACVEALAQTQGLVVPDTLTPTNHVVPRFDGTTGRLMGPTSLLVNSADRQLTFTSHSADNATNVALRVGSSGVWTLGANLATFHKSGTNQLIMAHDGGIGIGLGVDSFWGGMGTGDSLISFRDTSKGEPNNNSVAAGVIDGTGNGSYWQFTSQTNHVKLEMFDYDANTKLQFHPTITSTGSAVAHFVDTSNPLASGDKLFSIRTANSEKAYVAHDGVIFTATGSILGAATTSGIRLDLESGTLAVREGDDSAYGPLSAGTFNVTGTIDATSTITGAASVIAGASSQLGFTARARFLSPSDGVLRMSNSGLSDFNRLQFGGTSSSFPSIKRSSAELQVRLADDSADAALSAATINTGNGAVELAAGTYTPTLTAVANVTGSTQYLCQYSRVGDTVTVSGKIGLDPTTAATLTQLGISLPIASDFSAEESCGGTAASGPLAGVAGAILGDATNNRAELNATIGADAANRDWFFTFTYRVQ